MQIEESFRDFKAGLNFNKSLSRKPEKIRALILFSLLAQYILYFVRVAIETLGLHYGYQSNSVKNRRVLSYQFLGLRAFQKKYFALSKKEWKNVQDKIHISMIVKCDEAFLY